jgi:very-short-patch-repair endonuclease
MNYECLPYNPKLKDRARELRRAGNLSEVLLWQQLYRGKFKGYDFDRQKIIGNYIVDFFCPNCNTIIEIDGSSHNDKDAYGSERDIYLSGLKLTLIHISAQDVLQKLNGIMQYLYNHPALR